jgi:diguanylate cyclase (GGDEF)-like protein/PAS domain S-box-containing protein
MSGHSEPQGSDTEGQEATRARDALQAAQALLGGEELLALAEEAPVGLFVSVNPVGNVLVNRRLAEIAGRRRREMLGHGWIDAVHPDDRDVVRAAMTEALESNGRVEITYRVLRPDGDVRWVEVYADGNSDDSERRSFVGSMIDVTEFKAAEAALRAGEERFRGILDHAFDMITVLEADGTVRYTTPSASRILGYPGNAGTGKLGFDFIHPDDVADVLAQFTDVAAHPGLSMTPVQFRAQRADGQWLTLEAVTTNLLDDPTVRGFVVSARDVTVQRETEAALRASEERLRDQASILEMVATGGELTETLAELCRLVEAQVDGARSTVLLVSDDGLSLRHGAAPSFSTEFVDRIDGLPIAEGSGVCGTAAHRGSVVVVPEVVADPACAPFVDVALRHDVLAAWSVPILASSDGRVLGTFATYLREARAPGPDEEAAVESVLQLAAIAIERNEFEDRLANQAQHDPLTSLPNRALFGELLDHALARAQRSGTAVAVLFLDLDRFKVVNDSLGHDAGDELLVAIARRLDSVLRPGDVVARFGGDEFTVLCEDLDVESDSAARQAMTVAERLIDAVKEPVTLDEGDEQFVSASVGIALAFTGKERPEALLRDADAAMYRAKERGRGRCEVFDQEMRDRAQQRHEVENALHHALSREELRVFYQPVIGLPDGECVGVEALLRWQHPERGLLTPGDFLAAAEETGLIVPIGAWLLERACAQAVEWRRSVRASESFRLSVNLSGRQLVHSDLADLVAGVLANSGMRPDALCIEITETVLMEEIDAGVSAVKALKALGVCVSIDDFGTGYSALGYLRRFPIDEVKIDRTFVERLGTDPEDSAIVRAVVSLGHALGVTVTGEGVETPAQLAELQALGVDCAQGHLFAPAQPPGDLTPSLVRPHRWL